MSSAKFQAARRLGHTPWPSKLSLVLASWFAGTRKFRIIHRMRRCWQHLSKHLLTRRSLIIQPLFLAFAGCLPLLRRRGLLRLELLKKPLILQYLLLKRCDGLLAPFLGVFRLLLKHGDIHRIGVREATWFGNCVGMIRKRGLRQDRNLTSSTSRGKSLWII